MHVNINRSGYLLDFQFINIFKRLICGFEGRIDSLFFIREFSLLIVLSNKHACLFFSLPAIVLTLGGTVKSVSAMLGTT